MTPPPSSTGCAGCLADPTLLSNDGRLALHDRLTTAVLATPGALVVRAGAGRYPPPDGAARPWVCVDASAAPAEGAARLADPAGVLAERADRVELAGGAVASVLALRRWPARVPIDWLGALAGCVAAISVHAVAVDAAATERLLRRRLAALTSTAAVDEQAGRLADPQTAAAGDAARRLWADVVAGRSRLFRVQVLLVVSAADGAALPAARAEAGRRLAGLLAQAALLRFQQAPGYAAAGGGPPLGWPWRLLDAAALAATLPQPRGPARLAAGVEAGVQPGTGAPLRVDRFAAANPHRIVVGTSGAGKSYAAKCELLRHVERGVHAVVVDPEGEFAALAEAAGGRAYAVGERPAGLDPVRLAARSGLSAAEGLTLLGAVVGGLTGAPPTSAELGLLDKALGVLRAQRDGAASFAGLAAAVSELSAHPPFDRLELAGRLAPAATGSLATLFADAEPDADDPPLRCFDLRSVPAGLRAAVSATALAWAWSRAATLGPLAPPTLLVVDEAHLLLDDRGAAELLAQFARRARKYRVGLELVTQRLSDFLERPPGRAILATTGTKLLLGCEDHERAAIAAGLELSAPERALLVPGPPGRGLLLAPGLRSAVHVTPRDGREHALACSGPRA